MPSLTSQFTQPSRFPSPGSDSSSRMALDLAMGIKTAPVIADDYGLTPQELKHVLQTDAQLRLQVTEYRRIWSHPTNAKERVQVKAAVMAEDALMDVWGILTNVEANPSIRLDAHKHLSRLADVEPKRDAAETGPQFSLTLNLGGGEQVVVDSVVGSHDNGNYDSRKSEVYDPLPGLREAS